MFINPVTCCPPLTVDSASSTDDPTRPSTAVFRFISAFSKTSTAGLRRSAGWISTSQGSETITEKTLGTIERHRRSR